MSFARRKHSESANIVRCVRDGQAVCWTLLKGLLEQEQEGDAMKYERIGCALSLRLYAPNPGRWEDAGDHLPIRVRRRRVLPCAQLDRDARQPGDDRHKIISGQRCTNLSKHGSYTGERPPRD